MTIELKAVMILIALQAVGFVSVLAVLVFVLKRIAHNWNGLDCLCRCLGNEFEKIGTAFELIAAKIEETKGKGDDSD